MPIVRLSSGAVHYTESGQGIPLILLHANPGDSRDFEAVFPTFAQHYRVLAIDWPGYGESDAPDPHQEMSARFFCDLLREFLRAQGLSAALFVGNSLGGNAAARLAIESPDSVLGLVLVSPGGFTPHHFFTRAFCAFQGSRFALSPRRFAAWYLKSRTATVKAMLTRASGPQATPARRALNRAIWRGFAGQDHDLRQAAHAIKAPTLLLFGKYDPVISAKKDGAVAARCILGATLAVLECGHASFAEVPDAFLAQTLPFLARCAQTR